MNVLTPNTPLIHTSFKYSKLNMDDFSVLTTNKKGQMPPQHLITLTRGIQIRGQPIKIYKKKKKKKCVNFFLLLFIY
jgi:hypothetical protein